MTGARVVLCRLGEAPMPFGLPRPKAPGGLPVPFIAKDVTQLGEVEAARRFLCIFDRRCQVCGDPLEGVAVVYAVPGNAVVIDGCGVHPRPCAAMAERLCPFLRGLALEVNLVRWDLPTTDLEAIEHPQMGLAFACPWGNARGHVVRP